MKPNIRRSLTAFFIGVLWCATVFAQGRAVFSIDEVLQSHGALRSFPLSVQITGSSAREGVTVPVQITATGQEEVLYQYADKRKYVATPTSHFEADSSKLSYEQTPPAFAQLDVTSVFLLMQLRQRKVALSPPQPVTLASGAATRVRVRGERTEWHYRRFEVSDQLDLYIDSAGLLEGISRTLYENEPRWERTVAVRFNDYRDTQGMRLPYRIERYQDGNLIETIAVDHYAFDVPAGAALFARGRMR